MRLIILGSGSEGNCIYIGEGDSGILIDAGLSRRRIVTGLKEFGVAPSEIDAVFITHEHSDHCRGLPVLCKYEDYPVYSAPDTIKRLLRNCPKVGFQPLHFEKRMNRLSIRTIPLPHDAVEPLGFIVENGDCRMLIATDLGYIPDRLLEEISQCDAVVLESNHDVDMLLNGSYPEDLKRRILSKWGHLSNAQCSTALKQASGDRLKLVALAHLSKENNHPQLALEESHPSLPKGVKLVAAERYTPTGPFDL